jgi:hypothetical protein
MIDKLGKSTVSKVPVPVCTGVDPKFETLRNRDNCSERRFGWQQPVFLKWSSELR